MSEAQSVLLRNPELLPSKKKDRDLNTLNFTLLWAGMAIELAGFSGAAQMYPGLSAENIMLSSALGLLLVSVLLVLTGDIGLTYGIPFTVYMRACFGYKGAILPNILRIVPCMFWFGFQTWYAAEGLNVIMEIALGYSNLYLLIAIFGALQIANAAFGLKAMAKFDWLAIPVLAILLGMLTLWIFRSTGANIDTVLSASSDNSMSFSFAMLAVAGGWITMALTSPDLTRKIEKDDLDDQASFFRRNRKVITGLAIGFLITGSAVVLVGMVSGILTGQWNPIDVMKKLFGTSEPVTLTLAFLAIAFAQWSTNTAANLMPPAYILVNIFPKLTYAKATVLAGVAGLLLMPWRFGDYLLHFQVVTSGLLGPITGIMICDYYVIRKRKLNVNDLYKFGGQYTYSNNVNLAGVITTIVAGGCSLLAPDYSFFVSFGISIPMYFVIMKVFILRKYDQQLGQIAHYPLTEEILRS
jgi:NCS1 family nucleobase:cation symporter-1